MIPPSLAPEHILTRLFSYKDKEQKPSFWSAESGTKSYETILNDIAMVRRSLYKLKIKKGDPCLLLFHFSYRFLIVIFAMLAEGILPVLIDPRLNPWKWKSLSKKAHVRYIFLEQETRLARLYFFPAFGIQYFNVGRLFSESHENFPFEKLADVALLDPVLLSFTSGTTGSPKIVSRTLSVLGSQQTLFCNYLSDLSQEPHLALHGIGVIQSLIQGSPTHFIPSKQQTVSKVISVLNEHLISTLSLPPGVLDLFVNEIKISGSKIPSLKFIVTGGAALPKWLITDCLIQLPQSLLINTYASTECEPMSFLGFSVNSSLIAQFPVIQIKDYPDTLGYPVGPFISELQCQKKYTTSKNDFFEFKLQGANCVSIGQDYSPGDILYEKENILFYCGRVNEQIDGHPVGPAEEWLERQAYVKRAAIKKQNDTFVVFLELKTGCLFPNTDKDLLSVEINKNLGCLRKHKKVEFKIIPKMPVDPRHLWKIQRREL